MIESVQIATNRYAPDGADAINLYATGAAESLTLGQLVIAVSLHSAAAYEAQSVNKMNSMASGSQLLSEAADWLERMVKNSPPVNWARFEAFCINTLGVDANALPPDGVSFDRRMQAAKAMKGKMDALAQSRQQEMIDLQTLVNRRDVAYSTSSNIVRALGTSMNSDAMNF